MAFRADGVVLEEKGRGWFIVKLIENGHVMQAYGSGKIRMNHIRILPEDRVEVEVNEYDLTRGRIVYRHK